MPRLPPPRSPSFQIIVLRLSMARFRGGSEAVTTGEDNHSSGGDVPDAAHDPSNHSRDHAAAAELMVHALSAHRAQAVSGAPVAAISSPLRVLIADDYDDSAQSLAMLLSNAGAQTEIAMDGAQALARASRWHPHVCVLDISMPGLDGLETARRIREQGWPDRPLLIALTGWTLPDHRRLALEAGFDHYLTKPVEALKLARIIHTHYSQSAQSAP
jgi:CheY-like chemotaxis protein